MSIQHKTSPRMPPWRLPKAQGDCSLAHFQHLIGLLLWARHWLDREGGCHRKKASRKSRGGPFHACDYCRKKYFSSLFISLHSLMKNGFIPLCVMVSICLPTKTEVFLLHAEHVRIPAFQKCITSTFETNQMLFKSLICHLSIMH